MDRQQREHPAIDPCACGREARVYQRTGNRTCHYFVECSPCAIRTPLADDIHAACDAWRLGQIDTIAHQARVAA